MSQVAELDDEIEADDWVAPPQAAPVRDRQRRVIPFWRRGALRFWITAAVLLLLAGPLLLVRQGSGLALATDMPALRDAALPALLATLLAALVGLPIGAALWWRGLGDRPHMLAPFLAPLLVRGLDSSVGLPPLALLAVQAALLLPLLAMSLLASLSRLPPASFEGAAACGATPSTIALHLVLPLALPGALAGALLGYLLLLDGATGAVAVWLQAVALAVLAAATLPWKRPNWPAIS